MRIEIDTKSDSKEEIKHVIKLLMSSLGEDKENLSNQTNINDIFNSNNNEKKTSEDNEGYINIFAPNEIKEEPAQEKKEENTFAGFFSNNESYIEIKSDNINENNENNNDEDNSNQERDSFFKEYNDDDDDNNKKKSKISFY
jgi:hypothetical protein